MVADCRMVEKVFHGLVEKVPMELYICEQVKKNPLLCNSAILE